MTLLIYNQDNVPAELVEQNAEYLAQLTSELIPSADTRRGTVLFELLIKPAGFFFALAEQTATDIKDQRSLLKISQYR